MMYENSMILLISTPLVVKMGGGLRQEGMGGAKLLVSATKRILCGVGSMVCVCVWYEEERVHMNVNEILGGKRGGGKGQPDDNLGALFFLRRRCRRGLRLFQLGNLFC